MNTTLEELLDMIGRIENNEDAITTAEIARACGVSQASAARKVNHFVSINKMVCAGRKNILCMDGITRMVPCYRLAK